MLHINFEIISKAQNTQNTQERIGIEEEKIWDKNKPMEKPLHKESPSPPVPAKPNILYIKGMFVDIVCWTVG